MTSSRSSGWKSKCSASQARSSGRRLLDVDPADAPVGEPALCAAGCAPEKGRPRRRGDAHVSCVAVVVERRSALEWVFGGRHRVSGGARCDCIRAPRSVPTHLARRREVVRRRSGRAPAPSPAASASCAEVAAHDRLVERRPSRAAPASSASSTCAASPASRSRTVRTSHSGQRRRSVSPPSPRSRHASSWSRLRRASVADRRHAITYHEGYVFSAGSPSMVVSRANATGGGRRNAPACVRLWPWKRTPRLPCTPALVGPLGRHRAGRLLFVALLVYGLASQGHRRRDRLARWRRAARRAPPRSRSRCWSGARCRRRLEDAARGRAGRRQGVARRSCAARRWCSTCGPRGARRAARSRRASGRAGSGWGPRGIAFLGLNIQDLRGDARDFSEEFGLTYPSVRDARRGVADDYGATGIPETFFVDAARPRGRPRDRGRVRPPAGGGGPGRRLGPGRGHGHGRPQLRRAVGVGDCASQSHRACTTLRAATRR